MKLGCKGRWVAATLAVAALVSTSCGSRTQQTNQRGGASTLVSNQTASSGDQSPQTTTNPPPAAESPAATSPAPTSAPLPLSKLTWDGKSYLGTADLQLVPLN